MSAPMQPVKMYSTATCPYCIRAKALLRQRGVERLDEIRVDERPGERRTMIELTGRYTVPQILIDDRPVGGYDDIKALDDQGRLDPLLGLA